MLATSGNILVAESVEVPADAESIAALHTALERFWVAVEQAPVQPPDAAWRRRFATAVAEIGTNIVRHAYPPGTLPGSVRLQLRAYADRAEAHVTDHGAAFTPQVELDRVPMPDPFTLPEDGFGLAIVRVAVDEVRYCRTPGGENHWQLTKRL